jgi:hypothetical protein
MFYPPPNAGAYPPQGGRGIIGYSQPSMLVNLGLKEACSNVMPRYAYPSVWSGASTGIW